MNARNKGLTYCTLIKVYLPDKDLVKASEKLSKLVRTSDYIGTNDDGNAYLLLANTTSGDAAYVEKRLAEADFEYKIIDRLERQGEV
jgi:hypothetical protein